MHVRSCFGTLCLVFIPKVPKQIVQLFVTQKTGTLCALEWFENADGCHHLLQFFPRIAIDLLFNNHTFWVWISENHLALIGDCRCLILSVTHFGALVFSAHIYDLCFSLLAL